MSEENVLVLVKEPHIAFITGELYEILQGIDFSLSIEVVKFENDPIKPEYKLHVTALSQTFGPYTTEVDLLEDVRLWYKYNPIVFEKEEELGADGTLPPDVLPEGVEANPDDEVNENVEANKENNNASNETDF